MASVPNQHVPDKLGYQCDTRRGHGPNHPCESIFNSPYRPPKRRSTKCAGSRQARPRAPLTDAHLNRRKHTCSDCGAPLWQADASGPRRYPLANYVKHHMKGLFDLLIGDEVH